MTTGRHGPQLADDDLMETIADLIAAGETVDGDDGLTAAQIAAELPFARKTVAKHCSDLVAEGRLECGWGFVDGRPIRSYRPTDDRRLMTDGGQSEGGNERSDVPVAGKDEIDSTITESVRERFAAKEPTDEKKDELRREHTHHHVRNTHSQVTIESDVGPGIEAETTVEVPDMFCFTCDEWVGLSGVDLRGKPRSKDDAYYLDGPPEAVTDLRSRVRHEVTNLAGKIIDKHPHIETPEEAGEFIQAEVSRISDRMVVADEDVPDDPDPLPSYEKLISEAEDGNGRSSQPDTDQSEGDQ